MSHNAKVIVSRHETAHGTVRSYTAGFIASLILTAIAYLLVSKERLRGWALIFALAGLAVVQLLVQLIFFLHLGRESRPRWNLQVLVFAVGVVVIIVFGSLWIMKNLEYNHSHSLTPSQADKFLIQDEGYKNNSP